MTYTFEKFIREGTKLRHYNFPVVHLFSKGCFHLNPAATALLGKPEYIVYLFDPEARVVGMRPAQDDERDAYRVHYPTKGGASRVYARQFCYRYNIDSDSGVQYFKAELQGDTLIFRLCDEIQSMRSAIKKRREK